MSFADWLELSSRDIDRSYLGHVDYCKTIDYYAQLFGRDNVCVLLLEELIDRPEEYVGKLTGFLDIDFDEALTLLTGKHANRGIAQSQLEFESLNTKFFPFNRVFLIRAMLKFYFSLKKIVKKKKDDQVPIPEDWTERLRKLYAEGNRKLSRVYNLPVEKYGYPL